MMNNEDIIYAGFWIRTWASFIDTVLILMITMPLLVAIYGTEYLDFTKPAEGFAEFILSYVFPAVAVIIFWIYKSTTPGKMAIGAKIVDAETGNDLTAAQSIGRYFAYYVSILPLCLGIIWVGIDGKKQGWHDKLAGTVVIRKKNTTEKVKFG